MFVAATTGQQGLCDPRLAQFEIYDWLQTPVSTGFAARAISFYLTTSHPTLGLFDADLFLGDLAAHRTDFCSPLLLSTILASACVRNTYSFPLLHFLPPTYALPRGGFHFHLTDNLVRAQQSCTALEPDTAGLSHVFFAEAERLYSEEKTGGPQFETAIMTVAAAQLLSITAAVHGKEDISQGYLRDGIRLAHQNGLLAVEKGQSARNWLDDHVSHVNLKAASHAAWGMFCNLT